MKKLDHAVSGRRFLRAIFIMPLILLLLQPLHAASDFVVQDGLLKLGNSFYEIAFNKSNGGIAYITDKTVKANISEGNKDGILWWAAFTDGSWLGSINYGNNFKYSWNAGRKTLTLAYRGTGRNLLDVTVDVILTGTNAVNIKAALTNRSASAVKVFGFPSEITVIEDDIIDALLPMVPGAKLRAEFFTDHQSYDAQYPGVMCADYLSVRSARGRIAVYGRKGAVLQPVYLGFGHETAPEDYTKLIHNYKTWVASGQAWASPEVVVRIGQDYPETIAGYRRDNGIDRFGSLAAKLGADKQRYYESPMYKLDLEKLDKPFTQIKADVIDRIAIPGLLHPVAFQPIAFDHHYPDFLPPKAEWGDTKSLADLLGYAKQRGNLIMPYTNFSWWNPDAPTLSSLPAGITLESITVNQLTGRPVTESYGASTGYVMNLQNDFVRNRIAAEHDKLRAALGVDAIFEDQFGARVAPYDYNAAGLAGGDPSTAYFEGVLAHARSLAGSRLMTECGVDMLAKDEIGFMGSNYLWDLAGYRAITAPYTDYYPMIGMLCRDKVLLYQHDLAGETWTDDKAMFRWNLAYGYNFSGSLAWVEHPWLPLIGVFQKYALARYADQLVTGFQELGQHATRTSFGAYQVYANWDESNSYAYGDHIIAPGGAMVTANDGSVTAGVFACYNGGVLSDGDHYLLEARAKDGIKIFQPLGNDTELCLNKFSAWKGVKISAYDYAGEWIADVPASALKDRVTFFYAGTLARKKVCCYRLTPSVQPNPATAGRATAPDLVVTDLSWSPPKPLAGDKVTFTATVKNRGTGAVSEGLGLRVGFSLDDTPIAFWSTALRAAIPAGASVTVEAGEGTNGRDWPAEAGDHTLRALVDDTKLLAESDETNNEFSRALPSIAAPVTAASTAVQACRTNTALTNKETQLDKVWEDKMLYEVERAVIGRPSSKTDLAARFGCMWDATYLYVMVDVADDLLKASKDGQLWNGDCVELFFDMDGDRGREYQADDFQYLLARGGAQPVEVKHQATGGVLVEEIGTGGGYRMLIKIPWATLGKTPGDKLSFGFDVAVDDNDDGLSRRTQLCWNAANINVYQSPELFGACLLLSAAEMPKLRPTGPKNLALNKPAAASSHTDIYVAANANDGFTSSYWESTNNIFPSTLMVDLGEVKNVNKIVLKLPPSWEGRTQTLTVLGGTDNKTFTTVVGAARYNFDPASNNVVTITCTGARLRYLKLEFAENTGWPAGQVAEIEIYGDI